MISTCSDNYNEYNEVYGRKKIEGPIIPAIASWIFSQTLDMKMFSYLKTPIFTELKRYDHRVLLHRNALLYFAFIAPNQVKSSDGLEAVASMFHINGITVEHSFNRNRIESMGLCTNLISEPHNDWQNLFYGIGSVLWPRSGAWKDSINNTSSNNKSRENQYG